MNPLLIRRRGMMAAKNKLRYTIILTPSSYDDVNYDWLSASHIERGYTNAISSNYAEITNAGRGAASYIYYKFDTSAIPDGANIISVSCDVKTSANGNPTTTPIKRVQMFTGLTAKGAEQTMTSSVNTRTFNDATWTLSELRDIRVRAYTKSSTSTTANYVIKFYGATLTITYEI